MEALATLARMLGLPTRLAEDALHSERAAKAVLSRRSLFAAGAAMATGSVFSFPNPLPWIDLDIRIDETLMPGAYVSMHFASAPVVCWGSRLQGESDDACRARLRTMLLGKRGRSRPLGLAIA